MAGILSALDLIRLAFMTLVLLATTMPLGNYLRAVFEGADHPLSPLLGWLEALIYRSTQVDPQDEQTWVVYCRSLILFNGVTFFFTYGLLRIQTWLPLNPQSLPAPSSHLAFNAAMGFLTNTSWESYAGERAMSYFSQTVPLGFQFFSSAAVGLAFSVAVVRGIARKESSTLGNFWADLVRANLYVLLPMAFLLATVLMCQGVIQNFLAYVEVTTLEGAKQLVAQGPVASFAIMKVLGSNGGGFFNTNGAHPYENPTAISDFVQLVSMLLIPSALIYYLGLVTGHRKHAWSIWWSVWIVLVVGVLICAHFEHLGNPLFAKLGCSSIANMEGKEGRFGIFPSALFAVVTTASSCGAVNAALDSFTPIGGLVPLVNMLLGEVVYGGVGAGLCGILSIVVLTVFIAGLMIGRTPEYLGKKIGAVEMKFVTLILILTAFLILGFGAWGVSSSGILSALTNAGAHGLTGIVYTYASATMNNGSTFAGLSTNSPFFNTSLALAMFFGRFFTIIPMLALAGSLAKKKVHPATVGTFPVSGPLFMVLFVAVIVLVGALTFFPVLSLGPLLEHFEMTHASITIRTVGIESPPY